MNANSPAPALLILVVDDSATSRVVIDKQLRKLGCNVITAQDGASGLAALAKDEFDLVLLDCQMPDISGYEVAKTFRQREQDEELAYTPVIAISAETDAAHMQLCFESGMDGVLGKPLPVEELTKMLSLWCDTYVSATTATTAMTSEEIRSVDLNALFRTTSLDDFAVMQDFAEQADMPAVGRLAHRMKGAALTMGAREIIATLERIEAIATHRKQPAEDLPGEVSTLQSLLQAL